LRYVDIGINLGDPVFRGEYHGRRVHDNDLDDVIQRARDVGCTKFMVTGSDLVESRHAIQLAQSYRKLHTQLPLPIVSLCYQA
jgi:TatD DNase family protein